MQLDIWIEENDRNLVHDLFGVEHSDYNKVYVEKQKKTIANGITLQYKHSFCCDAENIPTWLIITAEIGKDVILPMAVGLLSSYIYDKLKDRKNEKLVINNQLIEQINAKKIEQVIIVNINLNQKEDNTNREESEN